MGITVYEDENSSNFYPLTLIRPVSELRCGAVSVGERLARGQTMESKHQVRYPWDLIKNLKDDLEEDLKNLGSGIKGEVHSSAVLYAAENILIEEGAVIEACAVLDARSGPIYIGKKTIIRPQSYLRGPLYIGPECRIGGEVTHSIIHGYSNKAHYGFLGHAYVGEWVNLGAGTTNSNLKNTYGTVKVQLKDKVIDTGETFFGCLIGDYAKLGIGTLINTGTVIGFGANVTGGGVTPKYIPDFSWNGEEIYQLDRFLTAAERVMGRRGQQLTPERRELIKLLHQKAIQV